MEGSSGRPLRSTVVDKMWRGVAFSGCEVVLWRSETVNHWLMASGHIICREDQAPRSTPSGPINLHDRSSRTC